MCVYSNTFNFELSFLFLLLMQPTIIFNFNFFIHRSKFFVETTPDIFIHVLQGLRSRIYKLPQAALVFGKVRFGRNLNSTEIRKSLRHA